MARFTVRIDSTLPAPAAWARVLDLHAHGEVIPLTSITNARYAAELAPGIRFLARTGWGPLRVDDPMVVDELRPPLDERSGVARIRKEGRVIRGWIELTVTPHGDEASTVEWVQELSVRGVPRALDPVTRRIARAAYGSVLLRLLARPHT